MRSYIFTEHERRLLRSWVFSGEESQSLRDLFTKIRANMTPIREDLELLNLVARLLQKERRFHSRLTRKRIGVMRRR